MLLVISFLNQQIFRQTHLYSLPTANAREKTDGAAHSVIHHRRRAFLRRDTESFDIPNPNGRYFELYVSSTTGMRKGKLVFRVVPTGSLQGDSIVRCIVFSEFCHGCNCSTT